MNDEAKHPLEEAAEAFVRLYEAESLTAEEGAMRACRDHLHEAATAAVALEQRVQRLEMPAAKLAGWAAGWAHFFETHIATEGDYTGDVDWPTRAGQVVEKMRGRIHALEQQVRDLKALANSHVSVPALSPDELSRESKRAGQVVTEEASPILMRLPCPECGELHIDEGEFATKPHHTHACQFCGHVWRPAVVKTVGVRFLPGFKNQDLALEPKERSPYGRESDSEILPLRTPAGEVAGSEQTVLRTGNEDQRRDTGERRAEHRVAQTAGEQRRGSESGAGLTDLARGRELGSGNAPTSVGVPTCAAEDVTAPDPAPSVPALERWDAVGSLVEATRFAPPGELLPTDTRELDNLVENLAEHAHAHYASQLSRLTEALAAERDELKAELAESREHEARLRGKLYDNSTGWVACAEQAGITGGPGGMQQAARMADAVCEALGTDRDDTSPGDIRDAINELEAERDELKQRVTGLRKGKGERERRINELTAELKASQSLVQSLREHADELSDKGTDDIARMRQLETERDSWRRTCELLEDENTDLRKRVSAAEERSVGLRVERDKLQGRVEELEARAQQVAEELSAESIAKVLEQETYKEMRKRITELEARPVVEPTDEELDQLWQQSNDGVAFHVTAGDFRAIARAVLALANREPKGAVRWGGPCSVTRSVAGGQFVDESEELAIAESKAMAQFEPHSPGTLHCVFIPDAKEGDDAE